MLCARANRSRERAAALERYTAAEHSPGMVATAIASMQGCMMSTFLYGLLDDSLGIGSSSLDGSAEDNGGGGSFTVRANAAAREVVAVLEVSKSYKRRREELWILHYMYCSAWRDQERKLFLGKGVSCLKFSWALKWQLSRRGRHGAARHTQRHYTKTHKDTTKTHKDTTQRNGCLLGWHA
eukprot:scaffold8301_cov35-Tisochrysis_lutea.AAC.1